MLLFVNQDDEVPDSVVLRAGVVFLLVLHHHRRLHAQELSDLRYRRSAHNIQHSQLTHSIFGD